VNANTALILQTVIAAGGIVASVTISAFISGTRWGAIQQDVRGMADRLAKIEGMFTLRLKDTDSEGPRSPR
jgi:hypothetical protein